MEALQDGDAYMDANPTNDSGLAAGTFRCRIGFSNHMVQMQCLEDQDRAIHT